MVQRQILRREHLARRRIDRDRKGDRARRIRRVSATGFRANAANDQGVRHLVEEDLRPLRRRHPGERAVRSRQAVGPRSFAIRAARAAGHRHQRPARARIANRAGASHIRVVTAGQRREQARHRRAAPTADKRRTRNVVTIEIARTPILDASRLVVHHVNAIQRQRRRRRTIVVKGHGLTDIPSLRRSVAVLVRHRQGNAEDIGGDRLQLVVLAWSRFFGTMVDRTVVGNRHLTRCGIDRNREHHRAAGNLALHDAAANIDQGDRLAARRVGQTGHAAA